MKDASLREGYSSVRGPSLREYYFESTVLLYSRKQALTLFKVASERTSKERRKKKYLPLSVSYRPCCCILTTIPYCTNTLKKLAARPKQKLRRRFFCVIVFTVESWHDEASCSFGEACLLSRLWWPAQWTPNCYVSTNQFKCFYFKYCCCCYKFFTKTYQALRWELINAFYFSLHLSTKSGLRKVSI